MRTVNKTLKGLCLFLCNLFNTIGKLFSEMRLFFFRKALSKYGLYVPLYRLKFTYEVTDMININVKTGNHMPNDGVKRSDAAVHSRVNVSHFHS